MSREPLETMPDVMDAKQLAEVLRISKAGTPTVRTHKISLTTADGPQTVPP